MFLHLTFLTRRSICSNFRCYAKDVCFGDQARLRLMQGVNVMADAVGATMGPKGRNAIIEQLFITPKITKDGATVANALLSLEDNQNNIGAKLIREAANNTNNEVGDGTTTSTVLARAIIKEGFEMISQGANPHEIRAGIKLATEKIREHLQGISRKALRLEEIAQVAKIAANGDESIGQLIHAALVELGRDGIIVVKDNNTTKDEVEIIRGFFIDEGFLSPFFLNQSKDGKVEYSNALVMLTTEKIKELKRLIPLLELAKCEGRPLLIIAGCIEHEALGGLILNSTKNNIRVCAVKAPSFGDTRNAIMGDMAVATGAIIFDNEALESLERVQLWQLGKVRDAVITRKRTLLLNCGGQCDQIEARLQHIRAALKEPGTPDERTELYERLARLNSGMAILRVGGSSDVEIEEKKDRVNDALMSTRAAIREGIVAGGGTAYLRCIPPLEELKGANKDQEKGIAIMRHALRIPCMTIAQNAGVNGAQVVQKVLSKRGHFGYDALQNDYCNLVQRGIIDSTAVVRTAITDAAGIASLLITAEATVTNEMPKKRKLNYKNVVERDIASMVGM